MRLSLVCFIVRKCSKPCRAGLLSLGLILPSTSALANTWTFQPGIDFGEIYSDNISLTTSQQARDEFVTEVAPRFSINNKARRFKVNLNYRLQALYYANESGHSTIYNQLNADSTAIVVDNLLYFDAGGNIGQQVISPQANVPFGNVTITGNRTNYSTYRLSPYIHHNFGTSAVADIRYNYNRVDYSQANLPSSTANQYSANLHSGSGFTRVSWGLSYSEQKVNYDVFPDITLKSAQGQLGYFMASSLNVFGTLGYEDNNFQSAVGKSSGRIWNVGFKWDPGRRTALSATYGQRFFGHNYSASFKHSSRLMDWQASYTEEITSVRDMQLASGTLGLVDTSGNITLVNVTFPQLTAETFIRKRYQLGVNRKLRSGGMSVQFYQEKRLYQTTGDEERLLGNTSSLSWSLNKRSTVDLGVGWERYDIRTGDRRDDTWYVATGVTNKVSRRVSTELQYRYSARDSTDSGADYKENRISAYIHAVF